MTRDINLVAYESDASCSRGKATKIIYPENAEEISQIIKSGEKFTIRGAGSGLAGGCIPQEDVVIDMNKMNKILSFDNITRTIEVEAGLILDELNDYLYKENLEFPVKPGSHSICTIGGMIATNAAGERAIKYGKTEKWVENLEIVDGKGEILKIGKHNIGDFTGMEGITGIIVKARLKLIEKKERTALLLSLDKIEEVVENAEKFKQIRDVSEIEFLDKLTSSLIGLTEKYHLIIELEGKENPAENIKLISGIEYDSLMDKRDSVYPSLASQGYVRIEDPKINLSRFQEFATFLENYKIPYYGHLGVGIIHPVFREGDKNKIKRMFDFVKKLKGDISGEHGIGLEKKEFLDENEKKLISAVKKRYDPHCKLNCGKVI